jgi:hypothetical protein
VGRGTHLTLLTGDRCFFGLVPVGDGGTYGFAGVAGERFSDPLTGRLERFRRRFSGFGGPVPAYLAALEHDSQLHFGAIEWMELDRWHHGRVVLAGDAAHAAPPHMGEGGALAMEDAIVLAGLSGPPARSRTRCAPMRTGAGHAPTGSSGKAGSPPGRGPARPRSATLPCANAVISCSATVTGRSSRPPSGRDGSN